MERREVRRIGSRGCDDIDEFLRMDGLLIDSSAGSTHALDWRSSHDLISSPETTCKRRDKGKVLRKKARAEPGIKVNLIYKEN